MSSSDITEFEEKLTDKVAEIVQDRRSLTARAARAIAVLQDGAHVAEALVAGRAVKVVAPAVARAVVTAGVALESGLVHQLHGGAGGTRLRLEVQNHGGVGDEG